MFNFLSRVFDKILFWGYEPISFDSLFSWTKYRGPKKKQYWLGGKPNTKRGFKYKATV
jgi:hypothetical protein